MAASLAVLAVVAVVGPDLATRHPIAPSAGPAQVGLAPSLSTVALGSPAETGSASTIPPTLPPMLPPSASPVPPLGGGFLVADRGNGRILAISTAGAILWSFPTPGSLPPGQAFSPDDAFLAPDHRTIVANDEVHQVVDRIDIATRRIVWQYGRYGVAGAASGFLHTPDDAYPLANGDVVIADIRNCRILQVAPDRSVVRSWGRTGACADAAPATYGQPNGDTPLSDGGLLITEIVGSRVVRVAPDGRVVFDIHVPVVYPSDAQLDPAGDVVVADFSARGQVVCVDPSGRLLWRYAPSAGPGMLDHPSLATPMPGGLVAVNDDFRDRLVVIDPRSDRIVWQYGRTDRAGSAQGLLSDPDGHQPFPPGLFGT